MQDIRPILSLTSGVRPISGWSTIVGVAICAVVLAGCATQDSGGHETGEDAHTLQSSPTGLPVKPEVACALLADKGLPAAGGYESVGGGTYVCSSFKKVLPLGDSAPHTLQFLAQGSAQSVTRLKVELTLRSPGDVQAALRMLFLQAQVLTDRVLGAGIPEEAQVAIRSGVPGAWSVGGAILRLERVSTFTTEIVVTLE